MKIKPIRQNSAPRQATLMGEPHMLAYINEAERQMLKRAGGAEAPGPQGIPVYGWWADTFGNGNSFQQSVANALTPNDGTTYVGGVLTKDKDEFTFADEVLSGNASDFAPPQAGGKEDANNDGVKDYDDFIQTYNAQFDSAQNDPTGQSTAGGFIQSDGKIGTVNAAGDVVISNPPPKTGSGGGSGGGSSGGGSNTEVVDTGPTPEELAEAARKDALNKKLGELANAFGFATDAYFQGLGTSYREGGLSEAFTTAYDDAVRGIYDVYKSAGMLTQSDVDDDLGILAGAEGGEESRLDSIIDQYVQANQNYVSGGQSSIEDTLKGFDTAEQINAFDIPSAVAPYKEPTEQAVVDFFTDFVKRSYDPSYNVDPSAVASGGPKRVSASVDEYGVSNQPSSLAGIFDPVGGSSAKVIS